MKKKSAIEIWIDNHRELLLLTIILPIGFLLTVRDKIFNYVSQPNPKEHKNRIQRVQEEVLKFNRGNKPIRTDRRGARSLTTRMADKTSSECIKMSDMRSIVSVDEEIGIVRVEPFVTIGELVTYLDKKSLQLEAAIEMKGATLSGLVLAIGMTTHSHISGLMHDIVEAYEIITADGKHIRATREGEHAELFRALPWSHGTLGLLVALELRITPREPYVRLVYRPFYNFDKFCEEHSRLLRSEDTPYYLEGQIFGRDRAVIIEGYPAKAEDFRDLKKNDVNKWHKPFFFKHVESMLALGEGESYSELVPLNSYLMRHERSMCMTMGQIIPTANNFWYRRIFGWLLPPNMQLLKKSRPTEERERSMRQQVYQDFAFPAEKLKTILEHLHGEFEIYPLLLYPCRVFDRGGMVRLPGEHGKHWEGETHSALYLNLGIYGTPKAIRQGNIHYPTVNKVREVEAMIRDWGGFLHTYVDVCSSAAEFEQMFDHSLWDKMRKAYGAEDVFPGIYDKIKPEIDPLQFVQDKNDLE